MLSFLSFFLSFSLTLSLSLPSSLAWSMDGNCKVWARRTLCILEACWYCQCQNWKSFKQSDDWKLRNWEGKCSNVFWLKRKAEWSGFSRIEAENQNLKCNLKQFWLIPILFLKVINYIFLLSIEFFFLLFCYSTLYLTNYQLQFNNRLYCKIYLGCHLIDYSCHLSFLLDNWFKVSIY